MGEKETSAVFVGAVGVGVAKSAKLLLGIINSTVLKIRRKTNRCLNCGYTLNEIYNFCPNCGQENNDNNVSLGTFISEFFANYLSFDTRIGRSIQPFFFRPGFLTNRFNEGQRMRYVHPLRLYLIISILFFFVATLLVQQNLEKVSLSVNEIIDVAEVESDSTLSGNGLRSMLRVMRDPTLSDQQARDSLRQMHLVKLDIRNEGMANTIFHQLRKVFSNDLSMFGGYIMQNLPVMMFIVLPLLALVMKLLYVRRKPLYIHHLVHSLHLHAFGFLVGTLYLLTIVLPDNADTIPDWVNGVLLLFIITYSFFSFLRVYQQSWYKTLLKFFLLGNIYFFLILFAALIEAMISFMIF